MAKGEGIDPTSGLRCGTLPEAVVATEGLVVVVRQTPQKLTIALSHLSYVGLRECPTLYPLDSPGLHAADSQSGFCWDWDSLVLFAVALSYFMKKID